MSTTSGISEKVEIREETAFGDGGAAGAKEFGYITKLSWTADASVTANYSTDGDHKPNTLTDGVLQITGGLDWDLTDGRELKCIFGTLTDGGAGAFSLATANTLPSYGYYALEDATQVVQGKGWKFSSVTINASRGGKITCTSNLVGQNIIESGETVTAQTPTEKPFMDLDISVTIDGGTTVDLEDFNMTVERNTEARRGLESTSANERRLITSLIEKNMSVTGSATAVAKKEILRAIFGAATIQDYRLPSNIVVTITNDTNSITFTMSALISVVSKDTGAEDDLMTVSFDFLGKSISAAGTYTV